MQTYSHFLLTAVLGKQIRRKKAINPGKPFLLGSVLPDVPLLFLTVGFIISWRANPETADQFVFGSTFDTMYFTNPWWIVSHNLFHAPLLLLLYGSVGYGLMRQTMHPSWQKWGGFLFWLAVGCGFHSLLDILTHVNDGPLLFFPFDWQYRFRASVSYWDPSYGGRTFGLIENALDVILLLYLGWGWWWQRQQSHLKAIER